MKVFSVFILLVSFFSSGLYASETYNPIKHLYWGSKDYFESEDLMILGAGTAVGLLSLNFDSSVRKFFDHKNRLGGAEKIGFHWGSGYSELALGLGTLFYGYSTSHDRELQSGEAQLEALAVTAGLVTSLKYTTGRRRPDGSSNHSFPSGHTSFAFSTAGSLTTMYGWKLGLPFILAGAFTGVSRLAQNRHYLSDVIFGALFGYVTGRAFTLHHLSKDKKLSWLFVPELSMAKRSIGFELKVQNF